MQGMADKGYTEKFSTSISGQIRGDVRANDQVKPTSNVFKLRQVRRNEVLVGTRKASINKEVRTAGVSKEGITVLGRVHFQSKHVTG